MFSSLYYIYKRYFTLLLIVDIVTQYNFYFKQILNIEI